MTATYKNPFSGKPAPFELSGLFMISPLIWIKICGHSMSGLMSEREKESLHKRLTQTLKFKRPVNAGLLDEIFEMLPQHPLKDDIQAAIHGDIYAQERMDKIGAWECFLTGLFKDEKQFTLRVLHLIEIERACTEPSKLVCQGRIKEAFELLSANSLMCRFFWPEAKQIFKTAINPTSLLPLQASILLEVLLSDLAAYDVGLGKPTSQVIDVLPSAEESYITPTKLFFHWLIERIGAKSMGALLDDKRAEYLSMDIVTLKRWSSGVHHPAQDVLEKIVDRFFDNDDDKNAVWARYWSAKYLNLMGYISQVCRNETRAPWPNLPFGHDSFGAWCQDRYFYWYSYHQYKIR